MLPLCEYAVDVVLGAIQGGGGRGFSWHSEIFEHTLLRGNVLSSTVSAALLSVGATITKYLALALVYVHLFPCLFVCLFACV